MTVPSGRQRARTYRKSNAQGQKETARRQKLHELILSYPLFTRPRITQTKLANALGCSQATVSRDLAKLRRLGINPFRILVRRRVAEIERRRREKLDRIQPTKNRTWQPLSDDDVALQHPRTAVKVLRRRIRHLSHIMGFKNARSRGDDQAN